MTDPLNPNDFFRILGFTPAAGFHPQTNPIFDITVKTFPGVNYLLERQSNLGQPFDPLDGGTFTATKFSETFQIELLSGRDFIRARVLPLSFFRLPTSKCFPCRCLNSPLPVRAQ
jgi:hypothetical protein